MGYTVGEATNSARLTTLWGSEVVVGRLRRLTTWSMLSEGRATGETCTGGETEGLEAGEGSELS